MTTDNEKFPSRLSDEDAALLGRLAYARANGGLGDVLDPTSFETLGLWKRVATVSAVAAGIEVDDGTAAASSDDRATPGIDSGKVRGLSREFPVAVDDRVASAQPGAPETNGSIGMPYVDRRERTSTPAETPSLGEQLRDLHQQLKERLMKDPAPVVDDHLLADKRRAWFMKAITQGNEHQEMMRRVFSQLHLTEQREVLSQMIDQYGHYRENQPRCQAISPETRLQLDELLGLNEHDVAHEVYDIASEHGLKATSVKTNLRTSYGLKIAEGFDLDEAFVPLVHSVVDAQLEVDSKKKPSNE